MREAIQAANSNTVVDSCAAGIGGGIAAPSGTLTLTHVTIGNNTALTASAGISIGALATATVSNTIIANSAGADCVNSGSFTDNGYNLFADGSCITAVTSISGDPLLGAVKQLSELTYGQAPGVDSPALDAIPAATNGCGTIFTADQRGEPRPIATRCDIGAYEQGYLFFGLISKP